MAWTDGPTPGTISGMEIQQGSTIQAELATAVNERLRALNPAHSLLQGTSTVVVPASNYSGDSIQSIDTFVSNVRDVIEDSMYRPSSNPGITTIDDLLEGDAVFVDVDTDEVYPTLASLISEGGYGSSWVTLTRPQKPDYYMQIRGVLEALTKCVRTWRGLSIVNQGDNLSKSQATEPVPPSAQDQWDDFLAEAWTLGPASILHKALKGYMSLDDGPGYFRFHAVSNFESQITPDNYIGSLTDLQLKFGESSTADVIGQFTVTLKIGGVFFKEWSPALDTTNVSVNYKFDVASIFSGGGAALVTLDLELPETYPYDGVGTARIETYMPIGRDYWTFWDLTGDLTYG